MLVISLWLHFPHQTLKLLGIEIPHSHIFKAILLSEVDHSRVSTLSIEEACLPTWLLLLSQGVIWALRWSHHQRRGDCLMLTTPSLASTDLFTWPWALALSCLFADVDILTWRPVIRSMFGKLLSLYANPSSVCSAAWCTSWGARNMHLLSAWCLQVPETVRLILHLTTQTSRTLRHRERSLLGNRTQTDLVKVHWTTAGCNSSHPTSSDG